MSAFLPRSWVGNRSRHLPEARDRFSDKEKSGALAISTDRGRRSPKAGDQAHSPARVASAVRSGRRNRVVERAKRGSGWHSAAGASGKRRLVWHRPVGSRRGRPRGRHRGICARGDHLCASRPASQPRSGGGGAIPNRFTSSRRDLYPVRVPTPLERFADWMAVGFSGGVRVRVLEDGTATVRGRTPGPPPERILSLVQDLAPPGPGTVDLRHNGRGRWTIQGSGALADARFQQRLRNMLGNHVA